MKLTRLWPCSWSCSLCRRKRNLGSRAAWSRPRPSQTGRGRFPHRQHMLIAYRRPEITKCSFFSHVLHIHIHESHHYVCSTLCYMLKVFVLVSINVYESKWEHPKCHAMPERALSPCNHKMLIFGHVVRTCLRVVNYPWFNYRMTSYVYYGELFVLEQNITLATPVLRI